MSEAATGIKAQLKMVQEIYDSLPFNRLLGLKVAFLEIDSAGFSFPMQPKLVGNIVHGMLHGGVISTVLDTTGGMMATASAIERMQGHKDEEIVRRIARVGTIDLRVDYLRPGKGLQFQSTGSVMRTGRKVAVCRMELKNQDDLVIAVGTGTYIVG